MKRSKYTVSERDIEIQNMIYEYIRDKLPSHKEDHLWIEFSRAPEWYN